MSPEENRHPATLPTGLEGEPLDTFREESKRIIEAHRMRDSRRARRFFTYEDLAHLYRVQERHRRTLCLLAAFGYQRLADNRILDVGCGDGNMLREFLQWGADPNRLAGIDLRPGAVAVARRLNPNVDVRCGSATDLPWPDRSFDVVCQHTVFTSIMSESMRRKVAAEMQRVLRLGGALLWYDFIRNHPWHRDIRGVRWKEIRALFPRFHLHLRSITPATPLVRLVPPSLLPLLYPVLASVPILRTHYIGLLIRNGDKFQSPR